MKSTTTKQSPVVDNAKFVEQERSSDIRIGGDELVKNGKNVVNGIENGNAAAISNGQVKSSSSSRNDVKEGNGVLSKKKDAKAGGTPSKKDKDKNKTKKTIIVKGKTFCTGCKKKCSGDVLRVKDDKYFHMDCFKCKQCKNLLAQSGFFCEGENYYCVKDYQQLFASKCSVCNDYIDGDLISVSGNKYHQKCLKCTRCGHSFATGEKVTYSGKDISCSKCSKIPVDTVDSENNTIPSNSDCAGCHEDLQDCQALIALDRQWHVGCLRCRECSATLRGEYMGKDGVPYCEKDYQKLFGVKCAFCSRFISGKVLQAGDNHHFHPTCARCSKCGDPFGDGQEMYLQGGAIWHPKCGPGPIAENGGLTPANNLDSQSSVPHTGMNGHSPDKDRDYDRASNSGASEAQFSLPSRTHSYNGSLSNSFSGSLNRKHYTLRAGSPGLILREYRSSSSSRYPEDISRVYTYSYLTEEPTLGYLKRPIEPYDRPPTSPHFHRPSSRGSLRGSSRSSTLKSNATTKSGMKILVDSIRSEVPRPKSPYMNNEEPIELAHFPAAKPPPPGEKSKIERDDFPAPPYPYSDPERRKRLSETYRAVSVSDEDDEIDSITQRSDNTEDKLKREEQELSKISSGIGKVFLQDVREREKMQKWKQSHVDPRNASRCPSAAREPAYRLRYQSPVNASPSRNLDHARAWEEEDPFERSYSYRGSSVGRSTGAISGYNAIANDITATTTTTRAASALKSSTLPASVGAHRGGMGDYSLNGLGKTGSNDYNVGKSNASLGSLSEVDNGAVNAGLPPLRGRAPPSYLGAPSLPYSSHFRRSLPNMSAAPPPTNLTEPGKAYPYHLLLISNYRLPNGVDRLNLERHLSDAEFEEIFQCPRAEFYRLPQWRRNELKKRARLF